MNDSEADRSPLAVIAIGGNSLIKDSSQPEVRHQWDAVRETAGHIATMIEGGWQAVITHGNGPQVGFILRRNELALPHVHPTPIDLIVADTQGAVGYMLQQALNNEFHSRQLRRQSFTIATQVRVAPADPAFHNPTKPIGTFLDEETARQFEIEGWSIVEDAGRGWRRVIASPEPVEIIEQAVIQHALADDWVVIAVGGGGIPVVQNSKGELRGVAAVIDKDLASSLLARTIGADLLLISTGVEKVALNFGTPNQQDLDRMTVSQARRYMAEGHFAPGSMQPKIEACIRFLQDASVMDPNRKPFALITNPENLERALRGETGTKIVTDGTPD